MIDPSALLKSIGSSGLLGGLAGGAISGALLSNKKARKTAKSVLKVGGIAALGGLAYKAYQSYQSGQSASAANPPAIPGEEFQNLEVAAETSDSDQLLIVRAMVSAAMADGHLSAQERTRVLSKIATSELSSAERSLLMDEISQPFPINQIVGAVDRPALAIEVYLASLMAIDSGCAAGQNHLQELAAGLKLQPDLINALQQQVSAQAAA